MDPELKKALDALGMTQSQAIEAQQKAHAEFTAAVNDNQKKRDAVLDDKIDKLQTELDKFEPLSKAIADAEARDKVAAEERKAMQEQLDRVETRLNRPGMPGSDTSAVSNEKHAAWIDWCRGGVERMTAERRNILTVSDDPGAGFLTTSEYLAEIIKGSIEFSALRALVRRLSTSQKSVQLPRRTGTFTASWTGETESRTEATGLAYAIEDVPVHELTAEVYISMAQLEDSAFDLDAEMRMEFSEQFGVAEGKAMVDGSGTKRPEGVLTAAGTVSVNSGAATAVTADGFIKLKYGIKTAYARRGTFILNRNTLKTTRLLKDGNGNYLWMPGLAGARPNTIDGDPYVEMPDMPDEAANAKAVAFGDWARGYVLVDRLQMSVIRDGLTKASQGQVKFIARRRIGGQVVLPEAIGIMKCAV